MARYKFIQNSFQGGEVSPKIFGRTDLEIYSKACEEIKNKFVLRQGGAIRRPGSQFELSQLDPLDSQPLVDIPEASRIIPFVPNNNETYLLIITVVPTGSSVGFASEVGFHIYRISTQTFVAFDTDLLASGAAVTSNWDFVGYADITELESVHFSQNGDLLKLTSNSTVPLVVSRTDDDQFSLTQTWNRAPFAFRITRQAYEDTDPNIVTKVSPSDPPLQSDTIVTVPYEAPNTDTGITFTPNATAIGAVDLTMPSTQAVTDFILKYPNLFGGTLKLTTGGVTGTVRIEDALKIANPNFPGFEGTILDTLGGLAATSNWEINSFATQFPRSVTFFEGRTIYILGDRIFGSQTGDLFEFMELRDFESTDFTNLSNDRPFKFSIASNESNQVQWVIAGKTLAVGTTGAEYIAAGPDQTLGIGPLNISILKQSALGSAPVQVVRTVGADVFIQRDQRTVREFLFDDLEQNFRSFNLSYFVDHIIFRDAKLRATILNPQWKYMSFQSDRNIIWFIDNNGGLVSTTRDRDFELNGWSHHVIGGTLGGEAPKVISMATVPNPGGTFDEAWVLVKRTIDSSDVVYLERIGKDFEIDTLFNSSTDIRDKMVYSDSAKFVRLGSPDVTFTGFDHLEGETVDVVADGLFVGTKVVSTGNIVLDEEATEIIAGLNYISQVTPLGIEAGSVIGSAQGTIKRIDETTIKFDRTIGGKVTDKDGNEQEIIFRPASLPLDQPIPLFNGDETIKFGSEYRRNTQVIVKQELPLPMTIVSITSRGITYDG